MKILFLVTESFLLFIVWSAPTLGQVHELPIFDAHIHYNRFDWEAINPKGALAIL